MRRKSDLATTRGDVWSVEGGRAREGVRMDSTRRQSVSLEYGVVENCAPNETLGLNGYGFTFDACAVRGGRPHMEDRWCAVLDEEKNAFVVAVYDGHGGDAVSAHLSRRLAREVLEEETLARDPPEALRRAFRRVDGEVCEENPGRMNGVYGNPGAGSTAIMALIMPPRVYVANVGDSRATALDDRGRVVFESKDQRPSVPEEKEKIVRDGGFVKRGRDGMVRTGGILAVSRAFGNAGIKYFLSAEPEVSVVDLDAIDSLILCSDGLTDVMDSRAASETMRAVPVGVMSSSPSPIRKRRVANKLVSLARVRQSRDNISVVVLQARKLASIVFPALETPVSDVQLTCGTPPTVRYHPALPNGFFGGQSSERDVHVSLRVEYDGFVRVVIVCAEDAFSGERSDGLSSPMPTVLRDSTQAITPIIHAS